MKRVRSKRLPRAEKVTEFAGYLVDPQLRGSSKKGKSKVSFPKIFREKQIFSPEKGFTIVEMASAYNKVFHAEENDDAGYPSRESMNSIRTKLKYSNKTHDRFLQLYSTICIDPENHKREFRWHITVNPEDSKKQTDFMLGISKSIELAANRRMENIKLDPVERMRKNELLDEFFGRDGGI